MGDFTLGVEEEFQIVDAETGELRPRIDRVLPEAQEALGDEVSPELHSAQVEVGTPVCQTLAEVRADLARLRGSLDEAARAVGCRIAATATHPSASWEDQRITPKARYLGMAEMYGHMARNQLISGCHVHVGIGDREVAIQTMNRVRPWLAPLLALASNSPFWMGSDTDYASYRSIVWARWPTSGPPGVFANRAEYDAVVESILATGVIPDLGMIYYDIRPSRTFDTIEFRVTDVCLSIDEAVMIAGLARALARTCAAEAMEGAPIPEVRAELLRVANWRAARSGVEDDLVDLRSARPVPAAELIGQLLEYIRPALDEHGDTDEVGALVEQTVRRGTGATRQREAFRKRESIDDVLDLILTETAAGSTTT